MSGDDAAAQLLEEAGIELFLDQPEHPAFSAAWQECLRIAQRIHGGRGGCRAIGLLPASAQVGSVGFGLNLTLAMHQVSGETVAYLDANLRWPGLTLRPAGSPDASEATAGPFAEKWLRDGVALVLPRQRMLAGAGLAPLETFLRSAESRFGACLVDLTGWKRLGDHLSAFELLDGIAVVARAGVTHELELTRLRDEIPEDRYLGVVLIAVPTTGTR